VKYFPSIISIPTAIVFLLANYLDQVSLTEIIGYGVLNLFFYYGVFLTYVFKNGRLIDKEELGQYVFRPSRLQPLGFSRLSAKDQKKLTDKYPGVLINNKVIRQCTILIILHPIIAIFAIWT